MALMISNAKFNLPCSQTKPESEISSYLDSFEITLKDPKQLSKGYKRRIQLRPELDILIRDYELHDCLIEEIQPCTSSLALEFGFHIFGSRKHDQLSPGQNFLVLDLAFDSDEEAIISEWATEQRVLKVDIHVEPDFLITFYGSQFELLPPELRRIFEQANEQFYYQIGTITPAMHLALQQILNCPYKGLTKQIYLESKALELIALRLEQAIEDNQTQKQSVRLRSDDIERIHHAKDILLCNSNNPPSLVALARQVGLNDCVLKKGFRQIFGTTVFGYLHDYRMQQARQLLLERKMKVEAVAHTVGYASRSSFTAAFSKKFGVTPSACLLKGIIPKHLTAAK